MRRRWFPGRIQRLNLTVQASSDDNTGTVQRQPVGYGGRDRDVVDE